MAKFSNIEWTDATYNPWYGCTKVSPACDHCYAESLMDTRFGKVTWGG
jgi:protein gp37